MRLESVPSQIGRRALTFALRFPSFVFRQYAIRINLGLTQLAFGIAWLLVLPAGSWMIARLYVPLIAPFFTPLQAWGVALGIILLLGISLVGHVLAHIVVARIVRNKLPSRIPMYLFADPAQVWPAARSPWHEAVVALSGPAMNFVIAGFSYILWDLQLHPYLNVSSFFLIFTNLGLGLMNLAPGFPLDGGRLACVLTAGLLHRPAFGSGLASWMGRLMVASLASWGIYLAFRDTRFGFETGASTLFVAMMLLLGLRWPAAPRRALQSSRLVNGSLFRWSIAGLLLLALLGIAGSLVPTTSALRAPGFMVTVEPMISVDAAYSHPHSGSFMLTTVIKQTPILAGQWLYGHLASAVEIIPPEQVVPDNVSMQELMQRSHRMLMNSEAMAVVIALRLAGYEVAVNGEIVEVDSVLPDSPVQGILEPGDRIIYLNEQRVRLASELSEYIQAQTLQSMINLIVERNGEQVELSVPLVSSPDGQGPPSLGITVQSAGLDMELPFPVQITPQKIVGGPSAGLMFTLTIYNLVTPDDLTNGWRIAGTGTINLDGAVGPIGGVKQKVAGAEAAGADYFLVPPANYTDAIRVARRINVVKVATVSEAIEFLRSLPPASR
jgi:PDZ domain-containing protein